MKGSVLSWKREGNPYQIKFTNIPQFNVNVIHLFKHI